MKIVSLTAENVKRLKAVQITPTGSVQVVAGRNAQGKSSVLDAIWLALGGGAAKKATAKPVRDGEESAFVKLDLGDIIVTRTWVSDTNTTLTVESKDGARYTSPQGMLDALVGKLAFDPLAFIQLGDKEQVQTLLSLVELPFDPDELDAKRLGFYEKRKEVGQHLKTAKGALAVQDIPALDVPDEEVSGADVLAEYEAAQAVARENSDTRSAVTSAQMRVADRQHDVTTAREKLATAEAALELASRDAATAAKRAAALAPDPDLTVYSDRLANVEATNRAIRAAWQYKADKDRVKSLADEYDNLTARIEGVDNVKIAGLAKATFPIDGLSFDSTGVTYNGIPFSQSSGAEQLRVSLAMAMAMNPDLRVIRITDGSLLDSENMALIESMATAADFQVWIERVDESGTVGVVIEDGMVAE